MKFVPKDPPRAFKVGREEVIELKDCGQIELGPDEQVTFTTDTGAEYDVVRKDWGFYATPSLNGRLPDFGLRAVLVRHKATGRFYLIFVESGKEEDFKAYVGLHNQEIVCWMDSDEALERLRERMR